MLHPMAVLVILVSTVKVVLMLTRRWEMLVGHLWANPSSKDQEVLKSVASTNRCKNALINRLNMMAVATMSVMTMVIVASHRPR